MNIFNSFDLLAIWNTDLASLLPQNPCLAALWLAPAFQKIHCFPTVTISVELALNARMLLLGLISCLARVEVARVCCGGGRWSLDPQKPNFPLVKGNLLWDYHLWSVRFSHFGFFKAANHFLFCACLGFTSVSTKLGKSCGISLAKQA